MSAQRLPYATLSPAALEGLVATKEALEQGPLGKALLELLYLRISQINGCAYCLGLHARSLRAQGETQERLDALAGWRASEGFTPRERAALTWAESLTRIEASAAPDADYLPLKAHFSDAEISDLTFAVALMNGLNRVAVGMRR